MNPDDTNTNPLDAALAKLWELHPDPRLRAATPLPWDTTPFPSEVEL